MSKIAKKYKIENKRKLDLVEVEVIVDNFGLKKKGDRFETFESTVGRVAKQRVGRDLDLMKAQAGDSATEPTRPVIAEQVHLMATLGQGVSHLRSDDATAADRRITWVPQRLHADARRAEGVECV